MNKVAEAQKILEQYQKLRGHIKFGQNPDVKESFEQNLFGLVQSIIAEHFPSLAPYAIGFQLVEKSKDNSKAFGIYGFRLKTLAFIPIFFDNGKVSGYEIIYLPRLDLFLPTTEPWIAYLKTKGRKGFGEPIGRELERFLAVSQPNLLPLRRPVSYTAGSLILGSGEVKLSKFIKKATKTKGKQDYISVILKSATLSKNLLHLFDLYPALFEKFVKLHGIETVKKAVAVSKNYHVEYKEPLVRVFTEVDIHRYPLPINFVNAIKKRGYYIQDRRTKFASLIPSISAKRFQAVNEFGAYEFITPEGEILRAFVVIPDQCNLAFVLPFAAKKLYYFDRKTQSTHAINRLYDPPFEKIYQELPDIKRKELTDADFWAEHIVRTNSKSDVNPVGLILLIDKYGRSFLLRGRIVGDRVELEIYQDLVTPSAKKFRALKVIPTDKDKLSWRIHGIGENAVCYLAVPNSVKYLPVPDDIEKLETIGPTEIFAALEKAGMKQVRISHFREDDSFIINRSSAKNYLEAKLELMKMGLKQKDADRALRDALRYRSAEFWIKPAASYTILNTESPTVWFGSEIPTSFAPQYPAKAPFETEYIVPGLRKPRPRDPLVEPVDQKTIQVVMKLDEANEGEVFDAGVFTILLKTTRDEYLIDLYIPNLIKSLDTLGRLLFILYYHRDLLEERYGESDYIKLLDNVKTNIENLGDLVIDLMQQDIDYYAGLISESEQLTGEEVNAV